MRNLPGEVTDQEIINAACPFGNVENVLRLKTKNQAFVQVNTNYSCFSSLRWQRKKQQSN